MSYFDGIFLVNDVYQLRLAEVWPTYGYGDPIITPIDSLYYLTKFVATGTNISYPFNADNSLNNFNVNVLGDAKASNFNPYTPGYYSAYFDGTGDDLATPSTSAFAFGTGDFTVEGWVYITSAVGSTVGFWQNGAADSCNLQRNTSGNLQAWDGADRISSTPVPSNTWCHVVFCRSATTARIFVNGVEALTWTSSVNYSASSAWNVGYTAGGTNRMVGYISNVRIVKGTALYTAAFTPPTSPLTAVSGTSLLTCQDNRFIDNSTNNFTITRNGDTKIDPADPFDVPASYASYGSTYLDGTGDYLSAPSNAVLTFGTGDFTVEFWVYLTANAPNYCKFYATGTSANNFTIETQSTTNTLTVTDYTATVFLTSSTALTLNTWTHVAVSRSGTSLKLFQNGVLVGSSTNSTNFAGSTALIGSMGSTAFVTGYISDVRTVKGTAVYTGNFTPPTAPLLPSGSALPYTSTANVNTTFAAANVSVLTAQNNQPHNNSTFLDKSNFRQLVTRTGNPNQGTFSPYKGSWSNYFSGASTSYIQTPASSITSIIGTSGITTTSTFTVECWIYQTQRHTAASQPILLGDQGTNGSIYWAFGPDTTGKLAFYHYTGAQVTSTGNDTIPLNTWTHIAMSINSGAIKLFVNGNLQTITGASTTGTQSGAFGYLLIGGFYNFTSTHAYIGYVNNLRIVKSALYSAAFTPSTTPLLPVTNTGLLTCQSNRFIDIGQNITLTTGSTMAVSSESPFSPAYTQPTPVSYSVAFDGTGDTISLPSDAVFAMGTGDFTIEFWFNTSSIAQTGYILQTDTVSATNSIFVSFTSSTLRLTNAATVFAVTGTLLADTWYHIAVVRTSGSSVIYTNGVAGATVACSISFTQNTPIIGSNGYIGYISNLRVVKGTAVYTGNFTPPILPLTLRGTSEIYSNTANVNTTFAAGNTTVLTCHAASIFNAGNVLYSNVNIAGDAKPLMGNPFGFNAPSLVDYAANVYGGSVYFDGNGDYLTFPTSSFYNLVKDFTVEAWIYPTRLNANDFLVIDARESGATAAPWLFGLGTSSGYKVVFYNGTEYKGTIPIPLNTWTHIAFERNGSVLTGYVNGARDYYNASFGTGAISPGATAPRMNSKDLGIGAGFDGQGYISDFRFTNGISLYKGPFVPSQIPLQPTSNTTVMLNFTDAAAKDYTLRNNMETIGDLKVSTVDSKFGRSSLYFDGTGDYGDISLVSNTLILGTSDFTAEMWLNPYTSSGTYYPMTIGSEAAGRLNIITVNGSLVLNLYGATNANLTLSGPVILPNTWTHIAVVRANANIRGYYNGNVLPNTYVTSAAIGNGPLKLGSDSTGGSPFFGYMDEVRITANARYTANFTPAIAVLPTR